MTGNSDPFKELYQLALKLLENNQQSGLPSQKELTAQLSQLAAMFKLQADPSLTASRALHDFQLTHNQPAVIEGNQDHEEWLAENISRLQWPRWKKYLWYLSNICRLPPDGIRSIDESTFEILKNLENPSRPGHWYRKGMVVGDIQSGKTGNYIGLINRAADAGYKAIIILAGLNNDLRSQTQHRVDEGFIGKDSRQTDSYIRSSACIGVGLDQSSPLPGSVSLTSALLKGDYRKNVHNAVTITPGSDPVIAVVKKNVTPLKNLLQTFSSQCVSGPIQNWPLLLIDDEADNASINTKASKRGRGESMADETNPTRINSLIRQILACFEQKAYVGYTATPFANIFIHPEMQSADETIGDDLFPRDFIINLHPSSNYFGPKQVFSLSGSRYSDDGAAPLPLVRISDDSEDVFFPGHKKDLLIEELPESMENAILYFVLASAEKILRGMQNAHNSMLVHVTRFVYPQEDIVDLIKRFMRRLRRALEFKTGPEYGRFLIRLKDLWETDLIPTTAAVSQVIDDPLLMKHSWPEIEELLYNAASRIETRAINGEAPDGSINYDSYKNGCWIIAVGGDKLSRGLTLEGLTVSYYSRQSRQYDTLLQMSRWFGYRDGYQDLCRLYTTSTLLEWYQDITFAIEELRSEFDEMAMLGVTPQEYGLRVRTHPGGLRITASNKMRNTQTAKVTFSGHLVETEKFYRGSPKNERNLEILSQWIAKIESKGTECQKSAPGYLWRNVKTADILDLLENLSVHNRCSKAGRPAVRKYIESEFEKGSLKNWTAAVVSVSAGEKVSIAGHSVGTAWRTNISSDSKMIRLPGNHLITPQHEAADLDALQYQKAMELTGQRDSNDFSAAKYPSGSAIRAVRGRENGLLLIYVFRSGTIGRSKSRNPYDEIYVGYALSFPKSSTAVPVEYAFSTMLDDEE